MLAADKLQLQSALKQQATALKEKEFSLHHNNLMTVGTQAAVLAGLDITMFIEFNPPADDEWGDDPARRTLARSLKMLYYGIIVAAFCSNMVVVAQTTTLSVLGGSLALRGPDGSMMTATDVLYAERKSVFHVFGIGLACTVGSVLVVVWIMLHWEAALMCWLVALWTARTIIVNYQRVQKSLDFDDADTPDFTDILEGPAAIRAIPTRLKALVTKPAAHSSSGFAAFFGYGTRNHSSRKSPSRDSSWSSRSMGNDDVDDDDSNDSIGTDLEMQEAHKYLINNSDGYAGNSNRQSRRGSRGSSTSYKRRSPIPDRRNKHREDSIQMV